MATRYRPAVPGLRGINLNLLVALDALLSEGSVTRAAERLGLSQSAMSHNLANLRALFDDPLFVRTPEGMEPTARARALSAPLRAALYDLERVVASEPSFDPATARRGFTVATADFVAARLGADVIATLAAVAPGVDLSVRPPPPGSLSEAFLAERLDLAILPGEARHAELDSEPLMEEPWACAMRRGHPAESQAWDVATYAACEHVIVSPTGRGSSAVDTELESRGLARHVRCRVPSFLIAPPIVARSELVLTAPRSQLDLFVGLDLVIRELPLSLRPLTLHAVWHRRDATAPEQLWFRRLIREAAGRRSGARGASS
jgi:DNA-binding transcriptional LysR family regulator